MLEKWNPRRSGAGEIAPFNVLLIAGLGVANLSMAVDAKERAGKAYCKGCVSPAIRSLNDPNGRCLVTLEPSFMMVKKCFPYRRKLCAQTGDATAANPKNSDAVFRKSPDTD
jgi:hypothetical protein